ncbi:hypothetical protein K435DRAFT_859150 [Dendrothele bispora CBS 962.96]|uniref:Uncharacterized protein n=1 Tax=Dendrothele bispora (strain CBS 962.96) TaxID=1314807 RepID=A0A4S8M1K4_DENBC|nr:hypothetical protein K435DRAFT_859150 [Dendrothele bispora CBS 962.96]
MAPIDILDDKTHITADRASSDDFAFSGSHRDSNDNSHHTTDQPFSQNENGFEFNDSHGHDAGANNHASTLYRRSGNSKGRDTGQYSKKTENVYDRNSADSAADISRSNSASEETSRSYHNTNGYTENDNRNVQGSNVENHGTYNENHGKESLLEFERVATGGLLSARSSGIWVKGLSLTATAGA